jgi:UPF0716 protein FxsA
MEEMFVLILFGVPVLEVFAFIEVAHAIGWLAAVVLLIGTSVLGARLLGSQGRMAIERVSLAVSQRRAPGRVALDGALGFVGSALLVIPGFVTDLLGVLLLARPTRSLVQRWLSRHYGGRLMGLVAGAGRFAPGARRTRPADVESTAYEEDLDQLER